ncbi:hypothetical protein GCM10027614_71930 [Micromonospora vulcania]
MASDAYTLAHLPLIAGVVYFALGIHLVLARVSGQPGPEHGGGSALGWTATLVLFGGVALYLIGRFLFLRLTVHASAGQLVAIGAILLLVPGARTLPAMAAVGLLTAFLAMLVLHERLTWSARVE